MAVCPKCGSPLLVETDFADECREVGCAKACGWWKPFWMPGGLSEQEKQWWAEYDCRQIALLAEMLDYPAR